MKICEIDKVKADLPCGRRAKHTLKITKGILGQHGKIKIPVCDEHFNILNEEGVLTDFLDPKYNQEKSIKYKAVLIKNRV